MYKKASKLQLRFATPKGALSVEQLWGLSQTDLITSIRAVKKLLKKTDDDELSFLEDTKAVDVENQLRFDIMKDVYVTKKAEADEARNAADAKAHNAKIDALIAEKREGQLRDMTIEQLEALRK